MFVSVNGVEVLRMSGDSAGVGRGVVEALVMSSVVAGTVGDDTKGVLGVASIFQICGFRATKGSKR